jgi:hypothetical protein
VSLSQVSSAASDSFELIGVAWNRMSTSSPDQSILTHMHGQLPCRCLVSSPRELAMDTSNDELMEVVARELPAGIGTHRAREQKAQSQPYAKRLNHAASRAVRGECSEEVRSQICPPQTSCG